MSSILDFKEALDFVKRQDRSSITPDVIYHNVDLVEEHLDLAKKLVKKEGVDEAKAAKIYTAITFLYIGYRQESDLNLEQGRELAQRYLLDQSVEKKDIEDVVALMKVAEDSVLPETLEEGIVSDVLHAYLGEKKLNSTLKKKWNEENLVNEKGSDYLDLLEREYETIKTYKYRTDTAFKKFDKRRRKNLNKLYLQINDYRNDTELQNNKAALTMFKTEMRNQVDLISIADQKSGLMISINALLLTILLPVFASYLIDMSQFLIPSVILMLTCGTSIILATLATRPGKMKGKLRKSNVHSGRRSVLDFSNFHEMDRDDYYNAVVQNMNRDKAFESSIINHLYDFGQTLGEKYKRLRLTYNVFAVGIALTVLTLGVSMMVPMGF